MNTPAQPAARGIRDWVCAYLGRLLGRPAEDIDLKCGLDAYALDSVDALMMAGQLEDAFGVEIDPGAFLRLPTLEQMVEKLERQLSGSSA